MAAPEPHDPEGYEYIFSVGAVQQLTTEPCKKKKHPLGFAPPKKKDKT